MAVIAAAMGAVMLSLAEVRDPWLRHGGCALAVLFALAFMFEAAGVGARLLVPAGWGDLVSGISQGINSLPQSTVPYIGLDEWVRTTILSGAGALLILAGALAFWPRATTASPTGAAVALGVIYGVPAVERNFAHPFLSGAALAILLIGFLWGERLERRYAGIAATMALIALTVGLILAPRVDGARPLLDPQHLADPLAAKGTVFSWTHSYGPLTWPRDGHEVLRVKAQTPTYWKAVNLAEFDGVRWRADSVIDPYQPDVPEPINGFPQWHQTITVVVRDLRSVDYIAAGTALSITGTHKLHTRDAPGTFMTGAPRWCQATPTRRTSTRRGPARRRWRTQAPTTPSRWRTTCRCCSPHRWAGPRSTTRSPAGQRPLLHGDLLPVYGGTHALSQTPNGRPSPTAPPAARSRYSREYALAQWLEAQSSSPYDFVRRVQREVRRNARYTESPPLTKIPLDTFLFGNRLGYCQQFSGAMALLLRMGGVPARVASGFAPGALRPQAQGVRRARPRRPLLGRGVLPGIRLGPVRPDAVGRAGALAGERDDAPSAAQGESATRAATATAARTPSGGASGAGGVAVQAAADHRARARAAAWLGIAPPRARASGRARRGRPGPRRARARAAPLRPDAGQRA